MGTPASPFRARSLLAGAGLITVHCLRTGASGRKGARKAGTCSPGHRGRDQETHQGGGTQGCPVPRKQGLMQAERRMLNLSEERRQKAPEPRGSLEGPRTGQNSLKTHLVGSPCGSEGTRVHLSSGWPLLSCRLPAAGRKVSHCSLVTSPQLVRAHDCASVIAHQVP